LPCLKVKQNSRVKAGLFSIVEKQKILELISSLLESFCPETGAIDLDDRGSEPPLYWTPS